MMRLTKIMLIFLIGILSVYSKYTRGGVYFYRNRRSNKVAYVGRTNNFERRHKEHVRNGREFSDQRYYRMDRYYTNEHVPKKEAYYIKKYKPEYNVVGK